MLTIVVHSQLLYLNCVKDCEERASESGDWDRTKEFIKQVIKSKEKV